MQVCVQSRNRSAMDKRSSALLSYPPADSVSTQQSVPDMCAAPDVYASMACVELELLLQFDSRPGSRYNSLDALSDITEESSMCEAIEHLQRQHQQHLGRTSSGGTRHEAASPPVKTHKLNSLVLKADSLHRGTHTATHSDKHAQYANMVTSRLENTAAQCENMDDTALAIQLLDTDAPPAPKPVANGLLGGSGFSVQSLDPSDWAVYSNPCNHSVARDNMSPSQVKGVL